MTFKFGINTDSEGNDFYLDWINFQGEKYPLRWVEITYDGVTESEPISIHTLAELLLPDGCSDLWASKEAEFVDGKIFFYVQDDEICLSDNQLRKIVEENL